MRSQGRLRAATGLLVLLLTLLVGLTAAWGEEALAAANTAAETGTAQDPQQEGSAQAASARAPIDLNSATLAQLLTLPIPAEVARNIHHYRTFERYFTSIYDLMEVPGMTAELLARLKPLVTVLPPAEENADIARLWASYRQVERYLGQEGANEGLVDEYLDQLRTPVNINDLDLFDLMSYQNVSPVDATAIIKARRRLGGFETARQLRSAQDLGMRYWAYRNLRDFVTYGEEGAGPERIKGFYQTRYYDTPYNFGDDEGGYSVILGPGADFAMTHRMRLDLTGGMKAGLMTNRNLGEESWHETTKGFYSLENRRWGPLQLKNLTLGNYRVSFGQGLVMDNTDFVLYRKTGYGYNKRPAGVRGDISRSREYALTGAAAEVRLGTLFGTFFVSKGKKDAILNPDGTVNQYVTMYPRWPASVLAGRGIQRDAFDENILGGNLKLALAPGSYVGFSGYEARYDRGFRADAGALVANEDLLEARDSELFRSYTSVFIDPETGARDVHKFRRVYGAEFQTVYQNVALQGEYAWLQDPSKSFLHGYAGDAFIVNGYAQWQNLNLLAIYRDYDVGFDNPYNRAFSNDTRYEQTLLDSYYRLEDDLYFYLSETTPQPKPEKGLFLDARYRISRNLIVTGAQFDQWERKADGMDMRRYTMKLEYQPIWNLRFRLRSRYSSRSEDLPEDVRAFRSWENRWQMIALLSNYNRLRFLYSTSNVEFPPRPRLSYPPETTDVGELSAVGTAGIPAHAFQAVYEHNLTDWIRLQLSTEMYDGFLWNFEGNEFILLDGKGFRNWFKVESRVSENFLMQLKVTRDHNLPHTDVDIRDYGAPLAFAPEGDYVPFDQTIYRLQLDYTF